MLSFIVVQAVTASVILVLSTVLAEKWNPKYGGFVMSFPASSAMILLFTSLQTGPQFAQASAAYTIGGLIPLLSFHILYAGIALHYPIPNSSGALALVFGFNLAIYFIGVWGIKLLSLSLLAASLSFLAVFGLFYLVYRKLPNLQIAKSQALTTRILLARACIGTALIVGIAELACLVGPRLGGALMAFPTTTLPTMWILHHNYGQNAAMSSQRGAFFGLPCIVVYFWFTYYLYSFVGVWWGTLLAYLGTCLFLLAFVKLKLVLTQFW